MPAIPANRISPPSDVTPAGSGGELIACHECDRLHRIRPVPGGGKALCSRCGALLYRHVANSLDKALALNLAALMLFVLANVFPFISLKLGSRIEENVLISGALALYRTGMGEVGLVVFLTSVVFPLITICGMLYVLLPLKMGFNPWKMAAVYRLVRALTPWSLLSVFMLGVLIAIVKLLDLASVIPGISLFALAALMAVTAAAGANLDDTLVWSRLGFKSQGNGEGATASEQGLIACHTCALLISAREVHNHDHGQCPRCASPLHSRKPGSLRRTCALVMAAVLLMIPANVYPVMTVIRFGRGAPDTILSGVIHLIHGGMWPLAMIVFVASIVVPTLKLIVLTFLMVSVRNNSAWRPRDRTALYRITEVVGAWSMVDIYLLAVLVALVNLDALATIRPGIGASFFGAVVIITMFAAHSFDPRLIWDHAERPR
jgi:paraquat-inducible protein A